MALHISFRIMELYNYVLWNPISDWFMELNNWLIWAPLLMDWFMELHNPPPLSLSYTLYTLSSLPSLLSPSSLPLSCICLWQRCSKIDYMLTPLCLCLSVRPSVSVSLCIYLCLSLCMSLYVCLSPCLYLSQSLSLCFSLSVCLCVCLSVSVCVSVSVSVSLLWYDFDTSLSRYAYLVGLIALTTERTFSRFIFFYEDITYVCNICGVGVTYKMVWSKYQNCIRYVSYVTYTYIYIYIYIFSLTQHILLFLIHLC